MPTTVTEFWWTISIGTGVFLSLTIGIIFIILQSQRRFRADQKEKFELLSANEERFRRLVEESPVPTLVTIQGSIAFINRAVIDVMKTSLSNDILGKSFFSFLPSDTHFSANHERMTSLLNNPDGFPATELVLLRCNGEPMEVEMAGIPHRYNNAGGLLIVFHDISKTKQAETTLREIPKKIIAAQEAERRRFSRELHDGVNQILFSVKGTIERMSTKIDPSLLNGSLSFPAVLNQLQLAMKEIQWISRNLRPSALDDLGLNAALGSMIDDFVNRTHIRVTVNGFPERRFPGEVELALFRIVQEALNNIEKHSMATQALVECMEDESFFRITVTDNGKGIQQDRIPDPLATSGIGMTTMKERAELIAGELAISSPEGKGTQIVVTIPREALHPHS